MIGISKLYFNTVEASDVLRYGRRSSSLPSHLLQFSSDKRPVVILNITQRCNLSCVHCYADASSAMTRDELSTGQWFRVIDDLASFGCPVVLFSGGEPLLHPDIVRLVGHAVDRGLRAVLSSNGTLVDPQTAHELKSAGLSYIGISLDGGEAVHDTFRGSPGSFKRALDGLRIASRAGIKTGVRFTMTQRNYHEIPRFMDIVEQENIPRICFYHLVHTGRGKTFRDEMMSHETTRAIIDTIINCTASLYERGNKVEVLTVDNHCDGPYLYMRLIRENKERAQKALDLLILNGGNNSGVGVAAVGWDGAIYPDQFWRNHILGSVLERPFGDIWTNQANEFLMKLKNKKRYVTGRCAVCRFLDVCGGNFRARAEALTGDTWASDPACYLTDREIGIE